MIKMTNLADYAVILMSFIAAAPKKIHSAADIALATAVPAPTVSKILGAMARAGLLISHRGLNGGFSMARAGEDISVADIISAVDGPIALTNCIEHAPGECDMEVGCGMRRHWQKINDAVRGALENIPLSELTNPVPDFIGLSSPVGASAPKEAKQVN